MKIDIWFVQERRHDGKWWTLTEYPGGKFAGIHLSLRSAEQLLCCMKENNPRAMFVSELTYRIVRCQLPMTVEKEESITVMHR